MDRRDMYGCWPVLVFCGLIGLMVWAYSSQSAKRRKSQAGGTAEVRK
jgi:hypothetical protein